MTWGQVRFIIFILKYGMYISKKVKNKDPTKENNRQQKVITWHFTSLCAKPAHFLSNLNVLTASYGLPTFFAGINPFLLVQTQMEITHQAQVRRYGETTYSLVSCQHLLVGTQQTPTRWFKRLFLSSLLFLLTITYVQFIHCICFYTILPYNNITVFWWTIFHVYSIYKLLAFRQGCTTLLVLIESRLCEVM